MAYASASDVALLCQNLLAGASTFTASSSPTLTAVNFWLSAGSSRIDSAIKSTGYSASVPSSATIYSEVQQLNALYGAAWAEMSRINVRLGPGERTRGQVFLQMFDDGLTALIEMDLTAAGLSPLNTVGPYAGGISVSDKTTVEADSDRVQPRFVRGQFRFPERKYPRKTSGS